MKTILTVLNLDIKPSIEHAHTALVALEPYFVYSKISDPSDRHDLVDAIAQLSIEMEAAIAGVEVDAGRRLALSAILREVAVSIRNNAWGALVGKDAAEGATIIDHVERFEDARRLITAHCSDLEVDLTLGG